MRACSYHAGNEITGLVVGWGFSDGEGGAFAFEEGSEVRHTAVIDASVGALESPYLRVF